MKVFTIEENRVELGAELQMVAGLKSNYPAIIVGEEGRGRKTGLVPVTGVVLTRCPNIGKTGNYNMRKIRDTWRCAYCASVQVNGVHPEGWYAPGRVTEVYLGVAKSGRPLFRTDVSSPEQDQRAVIVLRTPIGFRGGNRHQDINGGEFPLQILVDGTIAQGDAGAMGSGKQYIAVAKPGQSWKVVITGRRYGKPYEYYYHYDGKEILVSDKLTDFIDEDIIPGPTTDTAA